MLGLIVAVGIALRFVGLVDERPIFWDEAMPDPGALFRQPGTFIATLLEESWGRQGLGVLRLVGQLLPRLLGLTGSAGYAATPLLFQIALDALSALLIADLICRYLVSDDRAREAAGLWAATIWATSALLIRYSHRFLAPTYVLCLLLMGAWFFYSACARGQTARFLLAGIAAGCAFVTYPGCYTVLLCAPLLLLDRETRERVTKARAIWLAAGAAVPPLLLQSITMIIASRRGGDYYTYFAQLQDLSRTIVQGDAADNPFLLGRLAWAAWEFWLVPLTLLAIWAGIARRPKAFAWCAMSLAIYGVWVINGPVLGREIVSGRMVILIYAPLIVAAVLGLAEARWTLWREPAAVGAGLAIGAACACAGLLATPHIRNDYGAIKRQVAAQLGLPSDGFILVDDVNDYGTYLAALHARRLQEMPTSDAAGHPVLIAFHLRAMSHPLVPWLDFQEPPLMQFPSPIREPVLQFEGHSPAERALIRAEPELFDIKIYRLEDLRAHSPVLRGTRATSTAR